MDFETLSDQQIMEHLRRGSEDALIVLHRRYASAVYSVAYRVLGEGMAAEEVTQDTFLRLWDRAGSYDPARGDLLPWLLTIARRRAIDTFRQQGRRPPAQAEILSLDEHPFLEEQISGETTDTELRRSLVAVLHELPEEQRQVIALAYYYGLSHSDIAAHLGEPLGTVKTRLRLGMQKLREAWLAENPIGSEST